MTRSDRRLWKLTGNEDLMIKGRNKKSIEAELEFYQFKGGKTKSVRNRIIRLEKAMDIMPADDIRESSTKKSTKRAAKGYVIGRAGFAKISAVEGIRLTPTMAADFREFERKGLSPEDRRKAIAGKYGKAR